MTVMWKEGLRAGWDPGVFRGCLHGDTIP